MRASYKGCSWHRSARSTIVLGQALVETALALVQGILFLLFAPAVGISPCSQCSRGSG